jgi:hypothetical protein
MARAVLATTRKMLQGAIKRDAWLEIMVAWAKTPVANHELLLSCLDFIAKMMAGGVSISRVVTGVNRVVVGANRVVTGANRAVAEASSVVAERNCPDAVVSTDFRGALSVVASLIMALVDVISMKIFCHVCVFY